MQVIHGFRQGECEISPDRGVLGIAAVHRIAAKRGGVAEVLAPVLAVPAGSVCAADPRYPDARSRWQLRGCTVHNFSNNLMSGNERRSPLREFTFDDVKIGAADAAGPDFQQHVP
jgi:hypothetical protein